MSVFLSAFHSHPQVFYYIILALIYFNILPPHLLIPSHPIILPFLPQNFPHIFLSVILVSPAFQLPIFSSLSVQPFSLFALTLSFYLSSPSPCIPFSCWSIQFSQENRLDSFSQSDERASLYIPPRYPFYRTIQNKKLGSLSYSSLHCQP